MHTVAYQNMASYVKALSLDVVNKLQVKGHERMTQRTLVYQTSQARKRARYSVAHHIGLGGLAGRPIDFRRDRLHGRRKGVSSKQCFLLVSADNGADQNTHDAAYSSKIYIHSSWWTVVMGKH